MAAMIRLKASCHTSTTLHIRPQLSRGLEKLLLLLQLQVRILEDGTDLSG